MGHDDLPARTARPHKRLAIIAAVLCVASGTAVALSVGSDAATHQAPLSRREIANLLIEHGYARFATLGAQRALQIVAGQSDSHDPLIGDDEQGQARPASGRAAALPPAGLTNVRVNNPAEDTHQTDQTTQSETTVAVSGSKVAVGFNDSQQALLALTDGIDLTGYAYSTDSGKTFTDGGTIPNPRSFVNLGDPWLASDRAGRMFYGTLTMNGDTGNLEIGVARSTNGGKTWSVPTFASPNNSDLFYQGDKDAVTTGRDPKVASRDNVYATWDDTAFSADGNSGFNGLPVARSIDHGRTWSLHYADKIPLDVNGCSFTQYIGAQPIVAPSDGTLFVAAEKIAVKDPKCTGSQPVLSEVMFRSNDGGVTFGKSVTVATVTSASPTGAIELRPGQLIRTIEFPAVAMRGANMWVAWNDGSAGRSHIKLATSTDRGASWTTGSVTSGAGDELQPAVAVDASGLHVGYYAITAGKAIDTAVADSTDGGVHFTAHAVSSRSFPGVQTSPQFDPQIAPGYMGDYIALVSKGGHQYFAWGDNRDRVVNFTHPQGRNDPDVFFARR